MKQEIVKYKDDEKKKDKFITTITKPRKLETKVIKYENSGNELSVSSMTHISLPFFTKRRSNRTINLEYEMGSLGITLYSILSSEEGTQQPGEFEEKIYNFLLETLHKEYKKNRSKIDDIGNFLQNNPVTFDVDTLLEKLHLKKSNSYSSKINKALNNLSGVTYKIKINNQKKSQKAIVESFERRDIKLVQVEIYKIGKKKIYKVYLNNDLARSAFEKNLVMHFTEESNRGINSKSSSADRVYKFISLMRFKSNTGEASIDKLASVVPYELHTKNIVNGKVYNKSIRGKVIKALIKNFQEIKDLGYIKEFELEENKIFKYTFTTDKLGLVTDYTLGEYQKLQLEEDRSKEKKLEISCDTSTEKIGTELKTVIQKAKTNIYISKAWNKRVDRKIAKIAMEKSEKYACQILELAFENLKGDVEKTLVQYINKIMKDQKKEKVEVIQNTKEKLVKIINEVDDVIEAEIVEIPKISSDPMGEMLYMSFENYSEENKKEIEDKARKDYLNKTNNKRFNPVHEKIYKTMRKSYIVEIIKKQFGV